MLSNLVTIKMNQPFTDKSKLFICDIGNGSVFCCDACIVNVLRPEFKWFNSAGVAS